MRSSLISGRNRLYCSVLGLVASAAVSAAEIQWHAPDRVQVGAEVSVEIRVRAVTDLYAWQLDLQPSAHLKFNAAPVRGHFLTGPNGQYFIPGTPGPSGTLNALADTLLGPMAGVSGDGVLAQITLTATTAGQASLAGANILLLDATGTPIPLTNPQPTQQIQVIAAPVPLTPLGVLLLAAALLLLGARYLRHRA